jgi:hypothetical protein
MPGFVKPEYTILLIMLLSCIVGAALANLRGRSIVGWGVACALCPPLILVICFLKPRSRRTQKKRNPD